MTLYDLCILLIVLGGGLTTFALTALWILVAVTRDIRKILQRWERERGQG